jgi:hypothetical protein
MPPSPDQSARGARLVSLVAANRRSSRSAEAPLVDHAVLPSGEKTQVKAVSRVRGTARPVAANRQVGAMRGSGGTGWIMRTVGNLSYFR